MFSKTIFTLTYTNEYFPKRQIAFISIFIINEKYNKAIDVIELHLHCNFHKASYIILHYMYN